MARSITAALQQIKHNFNTHVTPADIHGACRAVGHEWRERILGPVLTVQAPLLQILHATAMTGVSRLTGVVFTPSAYCQALQRLPLDILRALLRQNRIGTATDFFADCHLRWVPRSRRHARA